MKSKLFAPIFVSFVIGLCANSAAAKAHKISRKVAVDGSFAELEIGWQSAPSSYIYRMKIFNTDGKIEVCGVGVFRHGQYRSATTQILRKRVLEMNGKPILKDFMFFARAKSLRKLNSTPANCVNTGVAAPRKEPKFEWKVQGSGRYRID